MTTKMTMILAGTCLVLAGCGSSGSGSSSSGGGGVLGPAELVPFAGTTVMSADVDENTVRVSSDDATVTLNDLAFDADGNLVSFSITLGLPDGSEVTFDETADILNVTNPPIGPGPGIRVVLKNDDGDVVRLLIGLGLDEPVSAEDIAASALFVLATVDPGADDPDFNDDTYMVTGVETDTLPGGSATYSGLTFATVIKNGIFRSNELEGSVTVEANFTASTVDIVLAGSGSGSSYTLSGTDLEIVGSSYGGELTGSASASGTFDLTGDLLGAFFGDDAEATAGVFGAEGSDNGDDVEIVGGFGAYDDAIGE